MKGLIIIYNLLFPLALLLMLPGVVRRMVKRGNYAHKFGQRFAVYSKRTRAVLRRDRGRWVWVHAVSVGEVLVALKFIKALQKERDVPVLLSTTTSTAFALASSQKSHRLEVIYHPVDFFLTARKVIGLVQPAALVLVEAEVWPNLTVLARKLGAPVLLINARLSKRSEKRFRAFRFLVEPLFRQLRAFCLQGEEDVPRYLSIGAVPEQLRVTGSIKFDPEEGERADASGCREVCRHLGWGEGDPVLLGASTHAGEEVILGEIFLKLREEVPSLRMILVPRHVERASKLFSELGGMGFTVQQRSRFPVQPADVLLVDTTGELRQWMEVASVVFVGKSLTAKGGQNPAEAIVAQKPVVFGEQMQNFSALVDLIMEKRGAVQVADAGELEEVLFRLLQNPGEAEAMAERALGALAPHCGATKKTVDFLLSLIQVSKK